MVHLELGIRRCNDCLHVLCAGLRIEMRYKNGISVERSGGGECQTSKDKVNSKMYLLHSILQLPIDDHSWWGIHGKVFFILNWLKFQINSHARDTIASVLIAICSGAH